jgi:hypothetical protein
MKLIDPQSRSGRYGKEKKKILVLPGIEPRLLDLVTSRTESKVSRGRWIEGIWTMYSDMGS